MRPQTKRQNRTKYEAVVPGSRAQKARCPKCGKTHIHIMLWIGRGIPRVYCPACRLQIGCFDA